MLFNPLTSVPPVTFHDKSWPYCSTSDAIIDQNWHHLSQLLQKKNIFPIIPRSKWSAQWAWNMTRMLRNMSEKLKSKIRSNYTWLLHGKNCLPWCMMLSHIIVWSRSKPSRRSIALARQIEKDKKKERWKTKQNSKYKILISMHAESIQKECLSQTKL